MGLRVVVYFLAVMRQKQWVTLPSDYSDEVYLNIIGINLRSFVLNYFVSQFQDTLAIFECPCKSIELLGNG